MFNAVSITAPRFSGITDPEFTQAQNARKTLIPALAKVPGFNGMQITTFVPDDGEPTFAFQINMEEKNEASSMAVLSKVVELGGELPAAKVPGILLKGKKPVDSYVSYQGFPVIVA